MPVKVVVAGSVDVSSVVVLSSVPVVVSTGGIVVAGVGKLGGTVVGGIGALGIDGREDWSTCGLGDEAGGSVNGGGAEPWP